MKTKQLLINWVFTLILGSALLPFTLLLENKWGINAWQGMLEDWYIAPIAAMYGALFSLPALGILLLVNLWLTKFVYKQGHRILVCWLVNTLLIAGTFTPLFKASEEIMLIGLPYLVANSLFYGYHYFKPYRKPQVLNFPV